MTKFEEKLGKKYKLKRQVKSGAIGGNKEDLTDSKFLYQSKQTDKKQIIIKLLDWEQLENHALEYDKLPIMIITMGEKDLFLIDENTFRQVKGKIK